MAYDKFNILTSSAVPLSIENVDTDQIIPARFLKATQIQSLRPVCRPKYVPQVNQHVMSAVRPQRRWCQ